MNDWRYLFGLNVSVNVTKLKWEVDVSKGLRTFPNYESLRLQPLRFIFTIRDSMNRERIIDTTNTRGRDRNRRNTSCIRSSAPVWRVKVIGLTLRSELQIPQRTKIQGGGTVLSTFCVVVQPANITGHPRHNELTQSLTLICCFFLFKIYFRFFLNTFFFNISTIFTTTVKTRCLVIFNPVYFSFLTFFFQRKKSKSTELQSQRQVQQDKIHQHRPRSRRLERGTIRFAPHQPRDSTPTWTSQLLNLPHKVTYSINPT